MTMNLSTVRWPAFLVCLFLAFAAITCWSLERAVSEVSPVVDPNYYSHGLRYNSSALELQTARALGWRIDPELDKGVLTIRVQDEHKVGIAGCRGHLTLLTKTPERETVNPLTMIDRGNGRYTVEIPPDLPTPVAASLTLTKDQATVQRQMFLSLTR